MNIVLLYLLLLKATATSFSGLTSLPVVRNDFVVQRQVLTDRQLNNISLITCGGIPLLVAAIGFAVWWQRRR